ncbi:FAD-dependent oxidoreductase, partial [Shewanella sp. CG12_big_fil_rev_8_21_14_0_65_47_15]|uniref:FAD-dependent oxidoreductase n=1 Tax=Shewanella sp. CG12_big_fil_rev_8_21_14_0_65_47_15 TaxID=1975537 RepID=UPI0025EBB76C
IGAGASGTAAALAAKQQGVNVILLEKTATQMGAGTLAGGMFAADSKQQKEKHQQVDKAWLYNEYMELSGGFINTQLVRKIIDEAGATVDWLNENGALMKLTDAGVGGAYAHIGEPATLHGYQEGGTMALKKLLDTYKKSGGKIYFSTPAKALTYDAKGQVTGVLAEKEDGTKLTIAAKAVIIATGGFGGNAKMLKQYIGTPFTMGEISQNKGDGIQMAWKAGAAERGINVTQYFWAKFSDAEMNKIIPIVGEKWWDLTNFTRFPNLRVNLDGKRFSDETDVTLFSVHGAELHMQPQETEFVIVDSDMLEKIAQRGTVAIENQYGKWKNNPFFFMEFNEPNDTKTLIEQENTPYDYTKLLDPLVGTTQTVFKANTLESLAKNMGVNQSNLVTSATLYNNAISTGKDDEFFSNTSKLIKVSTPPYYAVKFVARNLGTLGGVRINENIQAVDENNRPIKGLYVSGADAGGMYGKAYVDFEGGTLGFAYTSGRLAGVNAGQYVKSLK